MSLKDNIDDKLRYLCGLISPDIRLAIIILLLLAGLVLNFYFMFSTINNWSNRKNKMKIEHMNKSEIRKQGEVEQIKNDGYDKDEE